MNGTEFDESLDILLNLEEQVRDEKLYCKCVILNGRQFTNDQAFIKHIESLSQKIEEQIDKETFKLAKDIKNAIYESYRSTLHKREEQYSADILKRISSYTKSSHRIKILHRSLQAIIIIGATAVPFLLNMNDISKVVPTIISGFVALAAAIVSYYKLVERSSHLYLTAEKMQHEYNCYKTGRGKYSRLKRGAALDLFMDQIDRLIHEQNEHTLSLEKIVPDHDKEKLVKIV
jgi:hypothetical protein